MLVHEAIGRCLTEQGVRAAFGVVGSGNFHFTQALIAGGARFVAARHEGGAATMADAYARMSGEVAEVSLHQGCGYTNALTGITEAAKSRTPLLVLTAVANDPASNFFIDQPGLAAGRRRAAAGGFAAVGTAGCGPSVAALARGHGCEGLTVRSADDLAAVRAWLSSSPRRPLVIDAKITSDGGAWWLHEAFGH